MHTLSQPALAFVFAVAVVLLVASRRDLLLSSFAVALASIGTPRLQRVL
jgi:hypothetical protein